MSQGLLFYLLQCLASSALENSPHVEYQQVHRLSTCSNTANLPQHAELGDGTADVSFDTDNAHLPQQADLSRCQNKHNKHSHTAYTLLHHVDLLVGSVRTLRHVSKDWMTGGFT